MKGRNEVGRKEESGGWKEGRKGRRKPERMTCEWKEKERKRKKRGSQ